MTNADMAVFDQMASDQVELAAGASLDIIRSTFDALMALRERIAKGEALLKELQATERKMVELDLPNALKAIGTQEVTLDDGTVLALTESVQANITVANRPAAHAWLESHDHGGIIKRRAEIDVGRGEASQAFVDELTAWLDERERNATVKEDVHASTLKAFVRELLATEQEHPDLAPEDKLPRDLFGVFVVERVDVKPQKKARKKTVRKTR